MDNKFNKGDRIEYENLYGPSLGVIEGVLELKNGEQKVIVKWDDGFDDGEGNVFHADELTYESHTCPFQVEIHDSFELCNCGPEREQECAWEI